MRISALLIASWMVLPVSASRADEPQTEAPKTYSIEKDVVYAKPDGKELLLDVYHPEGAGPFPAVLVVHGGSWRGGSKQQLARYAGPLAERKYVAFAINYRLAPAHKFPAQIEDCRAALEWIRRNASTYHVDPERIGGMGYSAGAHLVALLGTTGTVEGEGDSKRDTRLQAVVAGGAPCDFRQMPLENSRLGYWLGGSRKDVPDNYEKASPLAFVSSKSPPMFFFNSTTDELVKPEPAKAMVAALTAVNVEADIYIADKGNNHAKNAVDPDALAKSWEFLEKHLRKKPAAVEGPGADGR